MLIEEISLRHFKRFREASFDLREGVNVVRGPNESGKSTLLQAMLAALFWRVDSTRREVRESVTWGESGGMRVELRGRVNGNIFHLVKDFSTRRAELSWDGERETDPARIQERLREWLGVGSEAAFRATAGIRQNEVADIAEGGKELGESLQAAVGGLEGGPGAVRAREAMERELGDLLRGTRGAARNPGPLARVEEEINALAKRREELSRAVRGREEARRRLAELAEESEKAAGRLEVLEALIRDTQERMDIEEDVEDFHRRYRVMEASLELLGEDEELAREEESRYGTLREVLEEERERLEDLEKRRAATGERMADLSRRLEEAATLQPRPWAPWVLAAGLTLVLAGLAGIALSPYLLALSLAGCGLVALSLFPGGYLRFHAGGKRLQELRARLGEARAEEAEITRTMERIVARAGCDSLEDFNRLRRGYLELLARRKEIAERLEMLSVRGGDRGRLAEEARRLAAEVGLRSRRMKELRGCTLDP
ncbi:MAG: AAA family ATPase, partial [Actinomycetota bacterium]|nr:AAA family ATPase [Actinomycetota bacterium]